MPASLKFEWSAGCQVTQFKMQTGNCSLERVIMPPSAIWMAVNVCSDQGCPFLRRAALWGFIGIEMACRMSSHPFQNVNYWIGKRVTRFKMQTSNCARNWGLLGLPIYLSLTGTFPCCMTYSCSNASDQTWPKVLGLMQLTLFRPARNFLTYTAFRPSLDSPLCRSVFLCLPLSSLCLGQFSR
jgi:hypothetical protein